MIKKMISQVVEGKSLSFDEMTGVMNAIMSGECTDSQIGGLLVGLRMKGETIDEIAAAASVMRSKATSIKAPEGVIDTCGTGGDQQHTFNVSTATAIVAAAGGAYVAKHGNRSVSSSSGSSQALEALGVNINASVECVEKCIEEAGIGFLFAPLLHGAMKYAIGPRKEMGIRTIFNVLGPLTNPAGAERQVMGVFSKELVAPIGNVLKNLGAKKALVVYGSDGLDELTVSGNSIVAYVTDGGVEVKDINPEEFGINKSSIESIKVETPQQSADIIREVFAGKTGVAYDMVVLNAGAALYVADKADTLKKGVELARETISDGKATATLEKLINVSNS
jgi:anthranilate phosphoribosyltransferase